MKSRIAELTTEEMSPRQRELVERITGTRGMLGGPFAFWVRLPEVADAADKLGNALRLNGKLDRKLFELMILAIARYWTAQYEWYQHEGAARKAGLDEAIIEAIRNGTTPVFGNESEQLAYDIVTELQTTKRLSDATFQRGLAAFGADVLIEAVTAIGFYTVAAQMINAFNAPVPGGLTPLPELAAGGAS